MTQTLARPSLAELHDRHTGKVCDKWEHYLDVYDRTFAGYRSQAVAMLEIGIQNGGSLEVWAKYFEAGRTFIGCDIDPNCRRLTYPDSRIHVVVGDAGLDTTRAQVLEKCGTFDIIIDDGSHTSGDIVKGFSQYFPYLHDGGVYVAEDLHCSYWLDFSGGLNHPLSAIAFFKHLVDVIHRDFWGVPLALEAVVEDFNRAYGCRLDADMLAHIQSIEFSNSMCIVRKTKPAETSLGRRLQRGTQAIVRPDIGGEAAGLATPDQSSNPWARISKPDGGGHDEDATPTVARLMTANLELTQQLHGVQAQIAAARASASWRLTAPLRQLSAWLNNSNR
jgi:hypothetical protein